MVLCTAFVLSIAGMLCSSGVSIYTKKHAAHFWDQWFELHPSNSNLILFNLRIIIVNQVNNFGAHPD